VRVASGLARRRQARWAVPVGAVAAVGIVIAGSVIARGQAVPALPARTTAQLLAAVDSPVAVPPAMTAVVQENASLGLPDLPGSDDPLSGISLLSGSHTFKIWYGAPARFRVAVPVTMGETDLRRDGSNVWLWDSQSNRATHYILPAGAAAGPAVGQAPTVPGPQQLARQILAAVGSTTTVGLQQNVTVAGQPAYQLTLAPKDSRSLIGQIRIAIDAHDSLPLQVQVFARGASGAAFSVGYTSLAFGAPAASNFTFAPPPGAKVKTVMVPAGFPGGPASLPGGFLGGVPSVTAPAGVQIPARPSGSVILSTNCGGKAQRMIVARPMPAGALKQIQESVAAGHPASRPKAQRIALLKPLPRLSLCIPSGSAAHSGWIVVNTSSAVASSSGPASIEGSMKVVTAPGSGPISLPAIPSLAGGPTVVGTGWLSVAVLPAAGLAGAGGQAEGVLSALELAATPVHGSWGSGSLLRTSLFSVLLLSDGRVLIGATVPSVLYSAAAHLR
jgi:outer membrane lipoprotein-sorting protein